MQFEFATASRILFGNGVSLQLPSIAASMGRRPLVVIGRSRDRAAPLLDRLHAQNLVVTLFHIPQEPTVDLVYEGVKRARETQCDMVVGIGGGSAMDAGKAIAALIANPGDIFDYLEVIGHGKPLGNLPLSYIAVPTTAGTGAEVTRNAVLASPQHRVKVSLRSPLMLPNLAIVDPLLTHDLPPQVTAGTGLDALTQLIEAFACAYANPLTDGICREGIRFGAPSLIRAVEAGHDATARENMSLASLFGGLALANAKLGAVHGIAGPLGGMISAPHGALCGRLLPYVTEKNIVALRDRAPQAPQLARYDEVARMVTDDPRAEAEQGAVWMHNLCEKLRIPTLGELGLAEADIPKACESALRSSSMKGNPVELTRHEVTDILYQAL